MLNVCEASAVKVALGHDAANLGDAVVVVYTSAVKAGNAEFEGGAPAQTAAGAAGGNAGRDHAAEELRRCSRDKWQNHDYNSDRRVSWTPVG